MTSIQNMNANDKITQQQAVSANAGAAVQRHLKTSLLFLLATGAGLAVASLYYSQPMLGVLGASIGASDRAVGLVPTLTQLGYALGIFAALSRQHLSTSVRRQSPASRRLRNC